MTKLTDELTAHLEKNLHRKFVKDERLNKWFEGADLKADIQQLKKIFLAAGLGRGDVVFMCLANSSVYLPINQALWQLGITAHPVAATTPAFELTADYQENDYPAMIFAPETANAFADFAELERQDIKLNTFEDLVFFNKKNLSNTNKEKTPLESSYGWILNTSGTTGKPKKVGLTHEVMRRAAYYDLTSHRLTSKDTVLIVMPMFHINAQELIIISTLLTDGKMVIAPKFSASKFWSQILENDVTWSSVVPTIVDILLKNQKANATFRPNHKLRFIRCASAILSVNRQREFTERYRVPILEGYGMTESCSQCTLNPLDRIKLGSVGKPYHTDVAIIQGDAFTTKPGVQGEIAIRGDHVITDYLDHHPSSFKEGWLKTGDLGYFDGDGYLWLNGRIKDIINHGGEKISPAVVEAVISELDFVKDVAVVPVPDSFYGENVAAAIITENENPEIQDQYRQEILAYTETHLAKYRRPTEIYFVKDFPRNATGKILRPKLTEQLIKLR